MRDFEEFEKWKFTVIAIAAKEAYENFDYPVYYEMMDSIAQQAAKVRDPRDSANLARLVRLLEHHHALLPSEDELARWYRNWFYEPE